MKKGLIFMAALLVVANASAGMFKRRLTIKNATGLQLQAAISYGAKGVCSKDLLKIMPRKTVTHKHGACCIKWIQIKATSGKRPGVWHNFQPKLTHAGRSCRDNEIKVTENPDHTLSIEQVK